MCSLLQICDLRSIIHGLAYVPSCFRQFSFFPILGHGEIMERMEANVGWVVRSQCDPHEKHQAQNRCLWMHFTPSPIPTPRYRVSSDPRRDRWWSGQQPSTQAGELHLAQPFTLCPTLDKSSDLWKLFILIYKLETVTFNPTSSQN